jgi:hypothetical protein
MKFRKDEENIGGGKMKKQIIFLLLCVALITSCAAKYQATYPLHSAVYKHDTSKMKELLQSGTAISVRDADGLLPIHVAASQYTTEPAALLIAKGADINARDNYGNAPIMIATQYCSPALIKLFVDSGAKTNIKDNEGNTILHITSGCIYKPNENTTILALLRPMDLDVNAVNKYGQTAYSMAMSLASLENINMEMVAVLRAKGLTERIDNETMDSFNVTLKKPSYFIPPAGYYKVSKEKEFIYQLAVEDCNYYSVPNKKGFVYAGPLGAVGYGLGWAVDQAAVPNKFRACMKLMGFMQQE